MAVHRLLRCVSCTHVRHRQATISRHILLSAAHQTSRVAIVIAVHERRGTGRAGGLPTYIYRWSVVDAHPIRCGNALLVSWWPWRRYWVWRTTRGVLGAARAASHRVDKVPDDSQDDYVRLGDDVGDLLGAVVVGAEVHDFSQFQGDVGHGALARIVQVEQARAVLQYDTCEDVQFIAQDIAQGVMLLIAVPTVRKIFTSTVIRLDGFLENNTKNLFRAGPLPV